MPASRIARLAASARVDADLDGLARLSRRDWRQVLAHYARLSTARRAMQETIADASVAASLAHARRLSDPDHRAVIEELRRQNERKAAIVAGLPRRAGNDPAFREKIQHLLDERVRALRVQDALRGTAEGRRALAVLDRHLDGVSVAIDPLAPEIERGRAVDRAVPSRATKPPLSARRAAPLSSVKERGPAQWPTLWSNIRRAIRARGGVAPATRIGKPASDAAVRAVEAKLGHALPAAFRKTVLTFAARVQLEWKLAETTAWNDDDDDTAPAGFVPPEWGSLTWDVKSLVRLDAARRQWAELYPDTRRRDGKAWQGKMAFQAVSNGDLLAIDRQSGKVVYLDHDAGTLHGRVLARNFPDFVERFSSLACPGPEHWLLDPFLGPTGLASKSTNSAAWRAWLGL